MNILEAAEIFLKNFIGIQDRNLAAKLATAARIVRKNAKEILFSEGDQAKNIFYVISGSVKLFRISEEGKESVIRFVPSNEVFAEITLYGRDSYPVCATALEKTRLLALDSSRIRSLCADDPVFVIKMLTSMASRLNYLVDMINGLRTADATERLLKYLRGLANKEHADTIKLPVAKGELAMLLGTTPETVSRIFSKLKKTGVISGEGRYIKFIKKTNRFNENTVR